MPHGHVVIIDDEALLVMALRRILAPLFQVTGFTRPREALDWLLSDGSCDVILCDLMMPELTGMQLQDEVGRSRPELARRFIFLSGSAVGDQARGFIRHTMNRVIPKPCGSAELIGELTAFIDRERTDQVAASGAAFRVGG